MNSEGFLVPDRWHSATAGTVSGRLLSCAILLCLALETDEAHNRLYLFCPFISVLIFFFLKEEKEACVVCVISFFVLASSRLSAQLHPHLAPNQYTTCHHLF